MSLLIPYRYPVKYYSWQDADAPQLANADGVIKTILKACLVTGYGDKQGAGWEMPFEDDYRMVVRPVLRSGNPPDIRIENGVINGAASHRIVLAQNMTGLEDAPQMEQNLSARDNACGKEWHLVVSDFAFIFCYQVLQSSSLKNYALYVGAMQNIGKSAPANFYINHDTSIKIDGTPSNYTNTILVFNGAPRLQEYYSNRKDIIAINLHHISGLDEQIDGEYFIQSPILDAKVIPPYFLSVTRYNHTIANMQTKKVTIAGRPMLRYVNKLWATPTNIAYIPLDYWEL